jgi:hypothetical protein
VIRKLLVVALALVVVRTLTICAYRNTLYYYGLVAQQFAIADAAYAGHWFAWDQVRSGAAFDLANRQRRHVPLEEWSRLQSSNRYTTFPATDLPGLGYVIAVTSRWAGGPLTTRYALAIQVAVELAAVLVFVACTGAAFGSRAGWLAGLVYVFGFPFIWPIASQPMRDVFLLGFYAAFVAALFVFARMRGPRSWLLPLALMSLGALLLWVRPHGYYFFAALAPLAMLTRGRRLRERAAFATLVVLVPWLVFGLPLRRFNLNHYGVVDTHAIGRTIWEHMGIVPGNPYGFAMDDAALVPWIERHYGRDVEYGSTEMNRLLSEYAWGVVQRDPTYFVRTMARSFVEMLKTPLDLVPPFPLVEYSRSGLSVFEFARAHPASFAYKVFNRVVLIAFFYGGLAATAALLWRCRERRWELAVLLSPLLYTVVVLLLTHFESRYMAAGAWTLVAPLGCALDRRLRLEAARSDTA